MSAATTVTQPAERASEIGVFALEREAYVEPEWFDREMELLFRPGWIFAGHVSEVAEPDQYLTVSWGDENAVILRTEDGELVAHHNVCRHRGFRIFGEPRGKAGKRIVCPYHGWCYEQTGELRSASRMPEPFDKGPWGLKPVWLDQWHGMLFVSFANERPAPLGERFDAFDLSAYDLPSARVAFRFQLEVRANWKVVVDNISECYHCTLNHPEFRPLFELDEFEQSPIVLAANGSLMPEVPLRPGIESATRSGAYACRKLLGREDHPPEASALLQICPDLLCPIFPDHAIVMQVVPLAFDRTAIEQWWCVNGAAVEGTDYDLEELTEVQVRATEEDVPLIEGTFAGMRSSAYQPGPYNPDQEPALHEFYDWYRRRMEQPPPSQESEGRPR